MSGENKKLIMDIDKKARVQKDQEARIVMNTKKLGDIINLVMESNNSDLIDKVTSL
jgi:hypothetical protein